VCKTDIVNDIFIAFGGDGKVSMLTDPCLNIHFNVILIQRTARGRVGAISKRKAVRKLSPPTIVKGLFTVLVKLKV